MSKKLDWGAIANVNFDDKRRKAAGLMTGKELFAKAYSDMEKAQAAVQHRQQVEPILKSELLNRIINKTPITVRQPIKNPTETLGGLNKSEEDDDGFYHGSAKNSQEGVMNAKFEEVMETIPSGTTLIFKSWDKQLGQFIFKSDKGAEYAIYDKSVIIFKGSSIENPGLYGLLFNTDLVSILEGLGEV